MNFRTLSDSEFLRYVNSTFDELTSTDLEKELFRRLERIDFEVLEQLDDLMAENEVLEQLDDLMAENEVDFSELKEAVEIFNTLREIKDDPIGDTFERLAQIFKNLQE